MEQAKTTFGERLKREREMRGVSLEEISAATRIATRFLEALENEQWERLPGGVFNRGFVRAVARFIGLNEENMVAEYALATDDRPDAPLNLSGATPLPGTEKPRVRLWLLVALAIAVLVGGWYAWHRYATARAARRTAAQGVVQSASPDLIPHSARSAVLGSAPGGRIQPPAQPGSAMAAAALGSERALELTIAIAKGRSTRVKVVADGRTLFDGKMTATHNGRFLALEQFEISAGDSHALLLELNGQTVAPMGTPGRPGKVTLTRQDLKKSSGGSD